MATLAEQHARFIRDLPAVLPSHRNEWAVYLDGFRHFCADQWDALAWASKNLGDDATFVIERVEEPRQVLLTAAVAFGAPR